MILASTPAANIDPNPYVVYRDHQRTQMRRSAFMEPHEAQGHYWGTAHQPRAAFDKPTRYPRNPVLVWMRRYTDINVGSVADVLSWLDGGEDETLDADLGEVFEDVKDHARKVLTRWIMLSAAPRLDPDPWVAWGVRYRRHVGSTYFEPRPYYSQNREDYS